MATLYNCPNIGNCDKADQEEILSIPVGAPVKCPACGVNLIFAKSMNTLGKRLVMLGGVLLFLSLFIVSMGWFYLQNKEDSLAFWDNMAFPVSAQPSAPGPKTSLLRIHGSNTIGGKLLPSLAAAYLQQEGYKNVHEEKGVQEDEKFIVGEHNGHGGQIEIYAHGSNTAFNDLKEDRCDIGMSSRKIKPEEQKNLLPLLGDLTDNASEHVIALDGIALIVHPSNPIKTLSISQVADIYSGLISDWSQVGGKAGPINVYARDDKSGTYDFFNEAVLKKQGKNLAHTVRRFEDSNKLSNTVNDDPSSIGFIGLSYIGANKVLAISDTGIGARKPSLLTVKTEDYLLTRRLYLYTTEKQSNPNVHKFIEFAVGSAAQPVVSSAGLVNLDITPVAVDANDVRNQSLRWQWLTQDATEIATRFRFRANGDDLDTRANRDIGRIVYLLSHPLYQGKKVILIGFADGSGSPKQNQQLSQKRADIVKEALTEEGVAVNEAIGIGSEAFVAPNDTDEYKKKNRRVEIWVK